MAHQPYRSIIAACEALLNDLARGVRASRAGALGAEELEALAHAATVAVVRLAAMALFEARGLVPTAKKAWRQRASVLTEGGLSWKRLRASWVLFEEGHRTLGLKPYPGEFFRRELAPLLHEPALTVEEATLEGLRAAVVPLAEGGGAVRQLGELYEALLGRSPTVARRGAPIRLKPDATRRRRRGSFYTPAYIVDTIVEATLGRSLAAARAPEDLLALKIADPACGTGHFLVGALHRLSARWAELTGRPAGPEGLRAVARACLYGVDVDPVAVELARASLMLEVGGDGWTDLTGTIRCGNALLGVSRAEMTADPPGAPTRVGLFAQADLSPPPTGIAAERLADAHIGAAFGLAVPDDEYRQALEEARTETLAPDAYPWLIEAARLARHRRFFHWELAFPEVFAGGGFDAVVSNPPYMVAATLPEEERTFLRRRFTVPGDLYVMNLELSFGLLKHGGRLGIICPRFFCFNRSVGPLRGRLLGEGGLVALIDAGRPFPGVPTECVILIIQASPPTGQETCRLIVWDDVGLTVRATTLPQATFARLPHTVFNVTLSPRWLALAEKLQAQGLPLGQVCLTRRGMELGRRALLEDRRAVPVRVGAEVVAFAPPRPAGRIDRFRPEFEAYAGLVRRPWRVLVRRVAPTLVATVDEAGHHFLKNLYAVVPRPGRRIGPYYLAACLNSRLMSRYFRIWWTTKKTRIFPEIQKYQLDSLPIVWEPEAPDEPEAVERLERFADRLREPGQSLDEEIAEMTAHGGKADRVMLAAVLALIGRRLAALSGEEA
ncbi:MAG: Eco57I restriction-modification methylase domain-containing protein, partial [Candidatus Tectimicrobiota bacterium]